MYAQDTEVVTSNSEALLSGIYKEFKMYQFFSKDISLELLKKGKSLINYKLYLNDKLIKEGKVKYVNIKTGKRLFSQGR